jgi:hypothetical protein
MRSFGVRLLAAAFAPASLLAGISADVEKPREQVRGEESGSKQPHSKAAHALTSIGVFTQAHLLMQLSIRPNAVRPYDPPNAVRPYDLPNAVRPYDLPNGVRHYPGAGFLPRNATG